MVNSSSPNQRRRELLEMAARSHGAIPVCTTDWQLLVRQLHFVVLILARKGLFFPNMLSHMTQADEEHFDEACRFALANILPAVIKVVNDGASFAVKMEAAAIKELDQLIAWKLENDEAKRKWDESGKDEKERKKKKKPKKPTVRRAGTSPFQKSCFEFIQGQKILDFVIKLPTSMRGDRLFAVILLKELWKLLSTWVKQSIESLPVDIAPNVPMLKSKFEVRTDQSTDTIRSIDEDSEVHRFIASGILTIRKRMCKETKSMMASKRKNNPRIRGNKLGVKLLLKMATLFKDLPARRDKSYDSDFMRALDNGGLSYVHPKFLHWGKLLMKKIRASISQRLIAKYGGKTQKMSFEFVLADKEIIEQFKIAVERTEGEWPEIVLESVRECVATYAFHARSEVEWAKYRAGHTDRTVSKEKKMGLRENLKGK
jgi:hypothetical protein